MAMRGSAELLRIAAAKEPSTHLVKLKGKDLGVDYGFEDCIYRCASRNEAFSPEVDVLGEGWEAVRGGTEGVGG
jgi:hypothetical protein